MMNNTKNNNFVYALICLICGLFISVVSSIYTFQMYFDFGYNSIDKFLTGCIGVAFDLGKIVFPILCGIAIYKKHWGKIIIFGLLTLFCLVNSFIASQGRDLNIATIYKSEAFNNSDEKKDNEDMKKAKKAEIATQTNTVNSLIDEKNKLPKNYITARKNKQIEIDTANKELKKLNNELTTLLNKKFDSKTTGTVTKGMYNLAKWINPENPDKTIGTIAIIKNIATELIGIAFILGFGILLRSKEEIPVEENNKPIPYPTNDLIGSDNITVNQIPDKNYSPLDDEIKRKKTIGFINDNTIKSQCITLMDKVPENKNVLLKNDSTNIEIEKPVNIDHQEDENFNLKPEILKYLDYIYKNLDENNYSPGKLKIKNATGLTYKDIDLIWSQLEKLKIIKLDKVKNVFRSKVLKSKKQSEKLINDNF